MSAIVNIRSARRPRAVAARPYSPPDLIAVDAVLSELEGERVAANEFARRYPVGTALRAFWDERVAMLDAAWQEIFGERLAAEKRSKFVVIRGGKGA